MKGLKYLRPIKIAHINHYLVENTKREIIEHARMQIVEYLANLQHAYSKNNSRTFMLLPNIKLRVVTDFIRVRSFVWCFDKSVNNIRKLSSLSLSSASFLNVADPNQAHGA